MQADIKSQLKNIPVNPGIYKFFDKKGIIIYIGKAKNLKNRVTTYFTGIGSHSGKLSILVSKINHFEFTIVDTEYQALLLENSLVKKYQPKYNVRLKDSKTFPFIVIKKEPFPRVFSTRTVIRDGSEYFGPYVSILQRDILLELIQKNFFIRTCNYNLSAENINKMKYKVCLNYHINLCKGPCEAHQSVSDYDRNLDAVRNILKGKISSVIEYVKEKMKDASVKLEFEKANDLKSTLDALKSYSSRATVVNPKITDLDVFSIYANEKTAVVNYLKIIDGSVNQTDTIEYTKKLDEKNEEILQIAIVELRERYFSKCKEVIVSYPIKISNANFASRVPKSGDKKKLLDLSYKNALYYYNEIQSQKLVNIEKKLAEPEVLRQAKEDLMLKKTPYTIECFDNSNIQGTYPVASMSVFKNGKPHNSSYRHFNIRTVTQSDDFATMEEVIYRRYSRLLKEEQPLPDLIVIDGGKGQLSAAMKSLSKLGLEDPIEIISIAKRLEEIFKPGEPEPLMISKRSTTLKMIQHIRNEAHRFGITHHRKQRDKGTIKTELELIEGIGPNTAQKLLKYFKSVKKIIQASKEELTEVVGKQKADLIKEYFS